MFGGLIIYLSCFLASSRSARDPRWVWGILWIKNLTIKFLQAILNLIGKIIYMIQKSFSFVHRQNVMHVLRIGHVDSYLQSMVMKHFSLKLSFINDVFLQEKPKGE